ncbi:ABC transporter ATP-binding protein [Quadrisphaera setariae]|uniref:ABC transporter ATP-binding protein n=1 Tax=Quadrisphaera setariae TaxID=2593304 RepID=A0A5C8ZC56_9ACTN|nr:ABC transporter ATP-binding protein [Quadrisphaera setariae]TXR55472.1 ABC transporter ATP-binding protein [Quadrisphaera setariae]
MVTTSSPTPSPPVPTTTLAATRSNSGGHGPRGGQFRGGPARTDPADREQLRRSPVSLRRIASLFGPHRWQVALVVVLIVASSVVSLASPFLVRAVIDDALPHADVRLLVLAVAGMVAVAAVTSLLGVVQTWISTGVGQQVMHRLRTSVFTHLQRQSMDFFTRTRGGEITSRLTNDIGGMQSVVTSTATSLASNATTVVGTAVAMAALSWRLSLLTLVVLPPAVWLTRRVALLRRSITSAQQRRLADLQHQVEESLSVSGALLTKTLGTGEVQAQRFAATSAELVDLEVRASLAGRWRMATMNVVFATIPALIYLAAGLPVTSGGMTVGTLVAFTALQAAIFRPLMGLLDVGVQLTASMALFSRVFEYLDLRVDIADPERPVPLDPARVRGEVRFEGVSFTYPGADRAALSDVDVVVPAGTSLALVGRTGSGKSTLASLVARLHDPSAGRVLLDGTDLRDLSLTSLASVVGVVSQETYLLHATVRENLRHARPSASDAEIEEAARRAQVHDVITELPDGYDTLVGARGHRFSGGEQQRLAIARTLLRDPAVLVLDEATSALDNRTERAVQAALDEVRRGRTTILIAHRLSTVTGSDAVAVLEAGRVVEQGPPEQLAAAGGAFAALAAAGARAEHDGDQDRGTCAEAPVLARA